MSGPEKPFQPCCTETEIRMTITLFLLKTTGARGILTSCLHIYFQPNFFISILFDLFFLNLTCSCQYSCNLMLTATYMCQPYIYSYVDDNSIYRVDTRIKIQLSVLV